MIEAKVTGHAIDDVPENIFPAQPRSNARNMDEAMTGGVDNLLDESAAIKLSTADSKGKQAAITASHSGELLREPGPIFIANVTSSPSSNSPTEAISTPTKGKQTTQNSSNNAYEGSSLILSMLSLIETGVENDRTLALYENRAENLHNYIDAITDQIENMQYRPSRMQMPVSSPLLAQSTVLTPATDAQGDNGEEDDAERDDLEGYDAEDGDTTDDDDTASTTSTEDPDTENANAESFLTSFVLFSDLPLEIRLIIWKMMLPGPRLVEIQNTQLFLDEEQKEPNYEVETFHATGVRKAPVGFFVCRESRNEVIKVYTALKSTDGYPAIWVDFKTDILCLRSERWFWTLDILLQRLAAYRLEEKITRFLVDSYYLGDDEICGLQQLAVLEEILLVPYSSEKACNKRIVGFQEGKLKPDRVRRYMSEVQEVFDEVKKYNPDWKQPRVRCGKLSLGVIKQD